MFVDVNKPATGASSQWIAESGIVDVFLLVGPRPSDVSAQFATVTGGSALPQMFALGCAALHLQVQAVSCKPACVDCMTANLNCCQQVL